MARSQIKNEKHVLITGASSGLGEALAKQCAESGYNLTLSARRVDRLHALKDSLAKINSQVDILTVAADLSDKASSKNLIDESIAHFKRLDTYVANAGQGMWTRFRDLDDPDELQSLMQINFMGVVYGSFYALESLRKSNGSFVAISSIQGFIPVAYHTGYVASKHAVNGFVETIRLEEPDIHFLLVMPSWIAGTELRAHALSSHSNDAVQVKQSHGKSAVPAQECATMIIDAWKAKKRHLYIPKLFRYLPMLRGMTGQTFDRIVNKKVKGQLES